MRVVMRARISGTRDGQDWPSPGEEIELPDTEAEQMLRSGLVKVFEEVDDEDPLDKAYGDGYEAGWAAAMVAVDTAASGDPDPADPADPAPPADEKEADVADEKPPVETATDQAPVETAVKPEPRKRR